MTKDQRTTTNPRETKAKPLREVDAHIKPTEILLINAAHMMDVSVHRITTNKELKRFLKLRPSARARVCDLDRVNQFVLMRDGMVSVKDALTISGVGSRQLWQGKKLRKMLGEVSLFGIRFYDKAKCEHYAKLVK